MNARIRAQGNQGITVIGASSSSSSSHLRSSKLSLLSGRGRLLRLFLLFAAINAYLQFAWHNHFILSLEEGGENTPDEDHRGDASARPGKSVVVRILTNTTSTTNTTNATVSSRALHNRSLFFKPGSLKLSRKETIARCYRGPPENRYRHSKKPGSCLYSERHNLAFWLTGKAASSTIRSMAAQFWNVSAIKCSRLRESDYPNVTRIVTTRHPLDRFISSYKEVCYRLNLFNNKNPMKSVGIPKFHGFMDVVQNMTLIEKLDVLQAKSPDMLGVKMRMLQLFLDEWQGEIFDVHLAPQVELVMYVPGQEKMAQFDTVMETETLFRDLQSLGHRSGVVVTTAANNTTNVEMRARSRPYDSVDLSLLSEAALQKVCRIYARDFCCLNYPLPEPCRRRRRQHQQQQEQRDDGEQQYQYQVNNNKQQHGIANNDNTTTTRATASSMVMCEWVDDPEESDKVIKATLV